VFNEVRRLAMQVGNVGMRNETTQNLVRLFIPHSPFANSGSGSTVCCQHGKQFFDGPRMIGQTVLNCWRGL